MPKVTNAKIINRILDANINRAKEGLRVCEEITRFIIEDRGLSEEFKSMRHKIDLAAKGLPAAKVLIQERDSLKDAGKDIHAGESKRKNIPDVFFANIQRVKESLRALEEFSKLKNRNCALKFKRIRYYIYEVEKKAVKKIAALCNH